MTIKYEAFDGTQFTTLDEAFDYEWREKYPNVRIFDALGNVIESTTFTDEWVFFYHIHNKEEKAFVLLTLMKMYGDLYFGEHFQNQYNGDDGYILDTENELSYVSPQAFKDYWSDDLNPNSELAYELKESD